MSGREPSRRRRRPRQKSRLQLLIVCGGERTEPAYFQGVRDHLRNPAVQVRVKAKGCAPEDLVAYARSIADLGGDEFDEVWCVVDVDDFQMEPAVTAATRLDVRLAVSNPCFELWLLLHHEDWTGPLANAADARRRLQRYLPDYSKSQVRFKDFASGVPEAVRRGERLEPTACDHRCNPSSGVWRLVRLIMDGGRLP